MSHVIAGLAKLSLEAWKISDESGLPFEDALEVAKARAKAAQINQAATSGAPGSETPPTFHPRIGWQIALFDAWPAICRMHGGRTPTATEAIRYLRKNDTSGAILQATDGGSLWWKPQRGNAKEVTLHTVENTISKWRTRGVLPA